MDSCRMMIMVLSDHGERRNLMTESKAEVLKTMAIDMTFERRELYKNTKRSKYYRHITDQIWGAAENYDLCLNSSKLGIDGCVDLIMHCCK